MQNLVTPRPGLLADVPASERTSREDMRNAADSYFEAVEQRRGGVRSIKILDVPGVDTIPMGGATSNLQAGEIFKIRGGQIHEIEDMGTSLPYGTLSGWE